jgi:hypothetical protein
VVPVKRKAGLSEYSPIQTRWPGRTGVSFVRKACELPALSRHAFADLLSVRDIPRHYTDDDLALDLDYARGQ